MAQLLHKIHFPTTKVILYAVSSKSYPPASLAGRIYLELRRPCRTFAHRRQAARKVGKGTDLFREIGRQYEELPVLTGRSVLFTYVKAIEGDNPALFISARGYSGDG